MPPAEPFFALDPEAGAHMLEGAVQPTCVFDTWLGDDVVRAHPRLLVTRAARDAIAHVAADLRFERIATRTSPFFRKSRPGERLPTFWAPLLEPTTAPAPLSLATDGAFLVSLTLLAALARLELRHATLRQR